MSQQQPISPIDILLVDDDSADVELTQKFLKKEKLCNAVTTVGDGVEAMKLLRRESPYEERNRPDLILLDVNMPRKNGAATLAEIKADESLKSIPVIVLSASDADCVGQEAFKLASGFVSKPVNLKQLSKVIRSLADYWICIVKVPPP